MGIKEFRKKYGQNVALCVCQAAYKYGLNGHNPKPSLGTASAIYAKDFADNPTKIVGYRTEVKIGCVEVYELQTETVLAQKVLCEGSWNYFDRSACIARLGENYRQKLVKCVEFPDELVVSAYNHNWRFVSIVTLDGCVKSSQVANFKKIGHILALNALGYYSRYLDDVRRSKKVNPNSPEVAFSDYLLKQKLELTPEKYFNNNNYFSRPEEEIGHYLKQKSSEMNTQISIASIEILGDFGSY